MNLSSCQTLILLLGCSRQLWVQQLVVLSAARSVVQVVVMWWRSWCSLSVDVLVGRVTQHRRCPRPPRQSWRKPRSPHPGNRVGSASWHVAQDEQGGLRQSRRSGRSGTCAGACYAGAWQVLCCGARSGIDASAAAPPQNCPPTHRQSSLRLLAKMRRCFHHRRFLVLAVNGAVVEWGLSAHCLCGRRTGQVGFARPGCDLW